MASNIKDIIAELEKTYKKHEDLEEMVNDLNNDSYYDHWADKLCTKEFKKNHKLAKSLFEIALEKADDFNETVKLADKVSQADGLNDKEWAKEIYQASAQKADSFKDFFTLGKLISDPNGLNDKEWAIEFYKSAADRVTELMNSENENDVYELIEFANSVARNDKEWAREFYQMAIDKAYKNEHYDQIVHGLQWTLDDEEWAKEIKEKYKK